MEILSVVLLTFMLTPCMFVFMLQNSCFEREKKNLKIESQCPVQNI
jgi:hypothetical protein